MLFDVPPDRGLASGCDIGCGAKFAGDLGNYWTEITGQSALSVSWEGFPTRENVIQDGDVSGRTLKMTHVLCPAAALLSFHYFTYRKRYI